MRVFLAWTQKNVCFLKNKFLFKEDDEFRVLYENEKKKVTSLESENAELRVELKSLRQSLKGTISDKS